MTILLSEYALKNRLKMANAKSAGIYCNLTDEPTAAWLGTCAMIQNPFQALESTNGPFPIRELYGWQTSSVGRIPVLLQHKLGCLQRSPCWHLLTAGELGSKYSVYSYTRSNPLLHKSIQMLKWCAGFNLHRLRQGCVCLCVSVSVCEHHALCAGCLSITF